MDCRMVHGGLSPPVFSLSVVCVHRVHVRVAGEGSLPRFLIGVPPVGDVSTGELPQRFMRLIEVGKSLLTPWRLRWWGQSGGWGFIGSRPR
jgi:hypothetical protein